MRIDLNNRSFKAGLTSNDVIVLCLLFLVLFGGLYLFMAYRFSLNFRPPQIKCVNNLKNLGLAARIFAENSSGRSPIENLNATNPPPNDIAKFFQSFAKELGSPKLLVCPADPTASKAPSIANLTPRNISYFANITAGALPPQAFLFGDNHLHLGDGNPLAGLLTVRSNTPLAWTAERHKGAGIIAMGDGSVQQMNNQLLRQALADQKSFTNVLLIR